MKSDYYKLRQQNTKYSKIYLEVVQDSLAILSAEHPENPSINAANGDVFLKESFDIDVMTVPFKLRPATQNLPRQLTVTLMGAYSWAIGWIDTNWYSSRHRPG